MTCLFIHESRDFCDFDACRQLLHRGLTALWFDKPAGKEIPWIKIIKIVKLTSLICIMLNNSRINVAYS